MMDESVSFHLQDSLGHRQELGLEQGGREGERDVRTLTPDTSRKSPTQSL